MSVSSHCGQMPLLIRLPLCGAKVLPFQAYTPAAPEFVYGEEDLVFKVTHPIFPVEWSRKIKSPADGKLLLPVEHLPAGIVSRFQPLGITFYKADGETPLNVTKEPESRNQIIIQHGEPMLEPELIPTDPVEEVPVEVIPVEAEPLPEGPIFELPGGELE